MENRIGKITAKTLESLTATDDGRIPREDGGIVSRVRAGPRGVTVNFRHEFKLERTKKDSSLGSWPRKSLASIRAERDRKRVRVMEGIDPTAAKKAEHIEKQRGLEATLADAEQQCTDSLTVKAPIEAWLEQGVARKDGNKELRRQLEKHVLPAVGHIELRKLTDSVLPCMGYDACS